MADNENKEGTGSQTMTLQRGSGSGRQMTEKGAGHHRARAHG